MRRLGRILGAAAFGSSLLGSAVAHATTDLPGQYDARAVAMGGTGTSYIENGSSVFLNPATLDGIQTFAVQKGHGSEFHVHVYCRQDKARSATFRVSMVPVDRTNLEAVAQSWALRPRVRLGPFHFGSEGESDGLLVIERQ